MESKEVAVQNENTAVGSYTGRGRGLEGVDKKDILIPRLQMTQAMSKRVQAGDALPGQFLNSVTGEVLGGWMDPKGKEVKEIEFLVIKTWKSWFISEKKLGETKFNFTTELPMQGNEGLLREEQVGSVAVQRDMSLNFFVLLRTELAEQIAFPMLLSFRRTSFKTGQVIPSTITRIAMRKPQIDLWELGFKLSLEQRDNGKGVFFVSKLTPGAKSSEAEAKAAEEWYDIVTGGANVTVAAEEDEEAATQAAQDPQAGAYEAPAGGQKFDV